MVDNVDFDYLANNIEVVNDIWVDHDRRPAAARLRRTGDRGAGRIAYVAEPGVGPAQLPGVGRGPAAHYAVGPLPVAAEPSTAASPAGSGPEASVGDDGRRADCSTRLVALDVFDQYVFPHQQLQRDATRMQLALQALEAGDPPTANETYVRRTGLTSAGRLFAYETYVAELARHDREFDRLQWGGQAHLAPYVDLWQEYHAIAAKIEAG